MSNVNTKPFPWKCGNCGEKAVVPGTQSYSVSMEHDGRKYEITIPDLNAPRCKKCGETVFDDAANRRISEAFRNKLGLLAPEQIRSNREALGLKQKELATAIGIAEATLSRWETGAQIQQRSLDRLLRVFFAFPAVRQELLNAGSSCKLGASIPSTQSRVASDEALHALSTHLVRIEQRLLKEFEASIEAVLPRIVADSNAIRWNERKHDLSKSVFNAFQWALAAPHSALGYWNYCLERSLRRSPDAPSDRWLFVPLEPRNSLDTELAECLSRIATALDRVPREKEAATCEVVNRFVDLISER